jgi:predicted DNA-binding protein YlxM (UPF0122 family)
MPDDKLRMTMLLDFFGELLTDKQREYYDLYHNEDLSLSEIAENVGITRQGVHDIIVRAENTLYELEEKTGIVRRFTQMQADIDSALEITARIKELAQDARIKGLARELEEILTLLKG